MQHDQASFTVFVSPADRGLRSSQLIAALIALLGIDNLLVLRFLGLDPWWAWAAGVAVLALLTAAIARGPTGSVIPLPRLAGCFTAGLGVMLLGGEGHLFYANYDWIIRDAVMQDMMRSPWPFAYSGHGDALLLRAPLGMYLLPAFAGKAGGLSAMNLALPIQNGFVLGTVLALGSTLFDTARARRIGLLVVLGFSGMDTIGQLIVNRDLLWPLTAHIEGWAVASVYCANLISVLWAPQHALAGWIGTILFLLWRTGRAPLSTLLLTIPLTLIWSPLATVGVLPFAAIAGLETVWQRRLTRADVALPALAVMLAFVPLLYLKAGAGAVGARIVPMSPHIYVLFELLEMGAWVTAVWLLLRGGRFGKATFAVCTLLLLSCCFVQIGMGADFATRVTLAPIAILSVLATDLLAGAATRRAMPWLVLIFAIGALTPLRDASRALLFRPTPTIECDLWRTWNVSFPAFPKATYYARWSDLPLFMQRASRHDMPPLEGTRCWAGVWQAPRFG